MFHWSDYVVFGASLSVCLLVGIYHAVAKGGQKTTEKYLLGNRNMPFFPVAISLAVSCMSSITAQGVPVEIYMFGIPFLLFPVGVFCAALLTAFTFIPLFYPLGITSINEYLERRFQSKCVRLFGCINMLIMQCVYVGCLMFGPAIALHIATGLNPIYSLFIINVAGTIYTSIGGIKAVVYTDLFQAVTMFAGLLLVLIMGTYFSNGVGRVLQENEDWNRLMLTTLDPDPRTRVSLWTCTFGSFFLFYGFFGTNQACTQRFIAMPKMQHAQKAMLLSGSLFLAFHIIACGIGLVLFAYYSQQGCDPIASGAISNPNQLLPQFVVTVLGYPTIPGIFIACLVNSSLSSLSSSVNAMAGIIWEDILKTRLHHLTDSRKTLITRITAFLFGALCTIVSFAVWVIGGNLSQVSVSLIGTLVGPLLGIYLLGAMVPFSNWLGALGGGCVSIVVSVWMLIGQILNRGANQPLPSPTDQCDVANTTHIYTVTSTHSYMYGDVTSTTGSDLYSENSGDDTGFLNEWIFSLSFAWYPFIGVFVTLLLGIIISVLTPKQNQVQVEPELLFPLCRKHYDSTESMSEDYTEGLAVYCDKKGDSVI